MITSLQNTTERLSSQIPATNIPQRMDAVQTALVKLEAQQKNTTLTLSYAMDLIQQITTRSLGWNQSTESGAPHPYRRYT